MKQWITGAVMIALALGYSQRADASIFVSINDGDGHTFSCDNSLAVSGTNCAAGSFFTSLNGNNVGFLGTFGDYTFAGFSGVNDNVPGDPIAGAFATDSKVSVTHTAGTGDLTVTFAALGFTIPTTGGSFSSSSTANWTSSASTDTAGFKGWANQNDTTALSGTLADSGICAAASGTTTPCATQSPNVGFGNPNGTFSLTGQEVIHLASGSAGSFQATETVSAVPEPVTFSLMGIGLLGLGLLRKRIG